MGSFRLWLVLCAIAVLFVGCQRIDIISTSPTHTHKSHGGILVSADGNNGIWPPQPMNMERIQPIAGNFVPLASPQSIDLRDARIKTAALNNAEVIHALGNDYLLLDINVSSDKAGNNIQEAIFFSYSNNVTVQALVSLNGEVTHKVIAAKDYQFPEVIEEIEKSVSLARQALVAQGFSNATTMNAHAMLTFPTVDANGYAAPFYDVRMLYVTVDGGHGAAPSYGAWVDLTNNRVTKSGPIGRY